MAFEYYMIRFHYSGIFKGEGLELRYINEIVDDLLLDPDKISYFEFIDFCKDVGYKNISGIFYLTPGCSLINGLREIKDGHSALEMAGYMVSRGVVDVFIEHGIDEVLLPLDALPGTGDGGNDEVRNEKGGHDEDHSEEYLSGSDDEELVSARLKFRAMLGEGGRSRNYCLDEGVNIDVNVVGAGIKNNAP
ncbi:hypothetical protein REPUB_Repub03eG0138300 [Reevesia pubescens]